MGHTEQAEVRSIDSMFTFPNVHSKCNHISMARFKDIVRGLSGQSARKLLTVAAARQEMAGLLEAYQRYLELSARIELESESARIGLALLFNVPIKIHPDIDPYDVSERERVRQIREDEDAIASSTEIDPQTLDLGQYPLWKIAREILRQVPEMRVYELEAHLKAFGVPKAERSAIESSLKTHRKQFRGAKRGREKFVAWKESNNDEGENPVPVPSRKGPTKAKRQRK